MTGPQDGSASPATPGCSKASGASGLLRGRWVLVLAVAAAAGLGYLGWRSLERRLQPAGVAGSHPAGVGGVGGVGGVATEEGLSPSDRSEFERLNEAVTQAYGQGRFAHQLVEDMWAFMRSHPGYAPGRVLLGHVLTLKDDLAGASEQFARALEIDPSQAEVWVNAGTVALKRNRVDSAVEHYRRAVALGPREPRFRVLLSEALVRRGDLDEAERVLREALGLDSGSHAARAALAHLRDRQGRVEEAVVELNRAIERVPGDEAHKSARTAYLRQMSGLLRRSGRFEEALQVLGSLPLTEQWAGPVRAEKALCFSAMGRPGDAARLYESASESDPVNWGWPLEAARWWVKAGDRAAAVRCLSIAQRLGGDAGEIAEVRGLIERMSQPSP